MRLSGTVSLPEVRGFAKLRVDPPSEWPWEHWVLFRLKFRLAAKAAGTRMKGVKCRA